MRYENPHYMAEDAGAADLIAGGRLQLGISRGSPEQVICVGPPWGPICSRHRPPGGARSHPCASACYQSAGGFRGTRFISAPGSGMASARGHPPRR
jgi:hypothetical protein